MRSFLSISRASKYMVCRTDGPCLAPWVGFFLTTSSGIDRTSYLALFNYRFLSVGLQAFAAGAVDDAYFYEKKKKTQSGHCILEEVSQISKISVLPISVIKSFDFALNGLNCSVLFKSSIDESRFK